MKKRVPFLIAILTLTCNVIATENFVPVKTAAQRRKELRERPTPFVSRDGFIHVFVSKPSHANYRLAVLESAKTFREDLETATNLKISFPDTPLFIKVGTSTNAVRTVSTNFSKRKYGSPFVIDIENPETLDLADYCEKMCLALLLNYAEHNGVKSSDFTMPVWFFRGLLRSERRDLREKDFDVAWQQWTTFKIPDVATLLTAEGKKYLDANPEVAGLFSRWIHETLNSKTTRLFNIEWTKTGLLSIMFPTAKNSDVMDRSWDGFILRQSNTVLAFGTITPESLRRWAAALDDIQPSGEIRTPEWMLKNRNEPDVIKHAILKQNEVQIMAAGRAPELIRIAKEYAKFYAMLVNRKISDNEAEKQLKLAEKMLMDLQKKIIGQKEKNVATE